MHPQNEPGDDVIDDVIDDDEFPALGGTPAPAAPAKKDHPEPSAGTTPRERSIEFEGADLDDSCPRLKVGDTVVFDVIENRFDGRRRPDRIKLSRRQTDDEKDAKKKEHSNSWKLPTSLVWHILQVKLNMDQLLCLRKVVLSSS